MRIRSQIAFLSIAIILIVAIVWISVYANGMKRLRKLEKTVQATWGDVEWRLEERNQQIPKLIEAAKVVLPEQANLYQQLTDNKNKLAELVQKDEIEGVIRTSNELDQKVKVFLKTTKNAPQLKEDVHFKGLRHTLSEIQGRIDSDRHQYNEAVERFNRFLQGIPGRFLQSKYLPKIPFEISQNNISKPVSS